MLNYTNLYMYIGTMVVVLIPIIFIGSGSFQRNTRKRKTQIKYTDTHTILVHYTLDWRIV